MACGTPRFNTPSLTHSAHQSDSRHRYLLGKPIYIWTNGGGEARPDQCKDIDTRSHARRLLNSFSPSLQRLGIEMNCWVRRVFVCACEWQKRHCNTLADTTDRAGRKRREEGGSGDTQYRHRLPPQSSVMVWGEHVNNKYLPLHHGGLLQQPVQHDTCWLPDLPQITLMLSHWAYVDYNTHSCAAQLCTEACIKSYTRLQGCIRFPAQRRGWASGFDPLSTTGSLPFLPPSPQQDEAWHPGVL